MHIGEYRRKLYDLISSKLKYPNTYFPRVVVDAIKFWTGANWQVLHNIKECCSTYYKYFSATTDNPAKLRKSTN